jgi:hypothetical protein
MTSSSDPSLHRHRQQRLVEHVQRLLEDERLRLDTSKGAKSVTSLIRQVERIEDSDGVKRMMIDMGLTDRELQNAMPCGAGLSVELLQKRWMFFRTVVGRLRVVCISPTKQLLRGETPEEVGAGQLTKMLSSLPMSNVPQTILVMSTSGFTLETHELADRRADRTVILVEPNEAGGWTVTGPPQVKALIDLLDPENEEEKRGRMREHITENQHELGGSGLAADRIAAKMQISQQFVDRELKAYAKAHPGLQAKRLDGRMVLFREGATIPSFSPAAGGATMPLIDRIKSLFSRAGEEEKKISFLSERRTALSQQRDRAYEEMATLEQQDESLKRTFRESNAQITKKRVTTQLLQLRKDLERRQQIVSVLNQQIDVVSTHLHNLELVRQGNTAQLPDAEEMTADAVKAEEMLAELEVAGELAGSTAPASVSGMTAEEKALFDELEAENKGAEQAARPVAVPRPPVKDGASNLPPVLQPESVTQRPTRRSEPEAG